MKIVCGTGGQSIETIRRRLDQVLSQWRSMRCGNFAWLAENANRFAEDAALPEGVREELRQIASMSSELVKRQQELDRRKAELARDQADLDQRKAGFRVDMHALKESSADFLRGIPDSVSELEERGLGREQELQVARLTERYRSGRCFHCGTPVEGTAIDDFRRGRRYNCDQCEKFVEPPDMVRVLADASETMDTPVAELGHVAIATDPRQVAGDLAREFFSQTEGRTDEHTHRTDGGAVCGTGLAG